MNWFLREYNFAKFLITIVIILFVIIKVIREYDSAKFNSLKEYIHKDDTLNAMLSKIYNYEVSTELNESMQQIIKDLNGNVFTEIDTIGHFLVNVKLAFILEQNNLSDTVYYSSKEGVFFRFLDNRLFGILYINSEANYIQNFLLLKKININDTKSSGFWYLVKCNLP